MMGRAISATTLAARHASRSVHIAPLWLAVPVGAVPATALRVGCAYAAVLHARSAVTSRADSAAAGSGRLRACAAVCHARGHAVPPTTVSAAAVRGRNARSAVCHAGAFAGNTTQATADGTCGARCASSHAGTYLVNAFCAATIGARLASVAGQGASGWALTVRADPVTAYRIR